MTSPSSTLKAFTDAASDAVARTIASIQREAQRESEAREAEFAQRLAELETRIASVAEIEKRLAERLETLKDGRDGRDGKDGERGPEGPVGKLPVVRDWSDGVHYEGDVVTLDGATWQARRDTGKEPPHKDWLCLASAGSNGEDGKSFNVRGTFSDREAYSAMDVVALNGASFVARIDEPGPCPGDGWQLLASKGSRGKEGQRGNQGDTGARGEPGLSVVAVDIDDHGMFTLTNGDGSTVRCDMYDVLSKVTK